MTDAIEEYISNFPPEVQERLRRLREVIAEEVPQAEQVIRYRMPTFRLKVNLVHFAGYQGHIGFYPSPSALLAFAGDLAGYERSKGAVRFPLDRPIPYELVRRMVRFRVDEEGRKE